MSKKSFLFYFLIIFSFFSLVVVKRSLIKKKYKKDTVSFYSDWKTEGKLISVYKVCFQKEENIMKMTLISRSDNNFIGFVPKKVQKLLTKNPSIYINHNNSKFSAKISSIGNAIDKDINMYSIKVLCPDIKHKKDIKKNNKYVSEIRFKNNLKNQFLAPYGAIDIENGNHFVWMVKENKVYKKFITIAGYRDNYVIVSDGLKNNDLIVVKGSFNLFEDDKVKINNKMERSKVETNKNYD